jgi:hypothetical protein
MRHSSADNESARTPGQGHPFGRASTQMILTELTIAVSKGHGC